MAKEIEVIITIPFSEYKQWDEYRVAKEKGVMDVLKVELSERLKEDSVEKFEIKVNALEGLCKIHKSNMEKSSNIEETQKEEKVGNIKRRFDFEKLVPGEKAIVNAAIEVEKMGADPKLISIQAMLIKAKSALNDYVDGVEISFLDRLIQEEVELGNKISALSGALYSDRFAEKVGDYQFELLNLQHTSMIAYRRVLNMRIKDLKSKN